MTTAQWVSLYWITPAVLLWIGVPVAVGFVIYLAIWR
jgi:hypothetical protein